MKRKKLLQPLQKQLINFLEEQVPDATTLLKFRHLLEEHNLGEAIFNDITGHSGRVNVIILEDD